MLISGLAKVLAVRPSTLRFYERIGLLSPAGQIAGRRHYHRAEEERLALILSAKESGFTLKEIKDLISAAARGQSPRALWREVATAKRIRLEREMQKLRAAERSLKRKAGCRCKTLRECERLLSKELRARSRDKTAAIPPR